MKIYNEQIALQSQKAREVFNITTQVKAAIEKSALREGIAVVSALQSGTALLVAEDASRLMAEVNAWLDDISGVGAESGKATTILPALVTHQLTVPFTESRPELAPQQGIFFLEMEGTRPRRIVVKILGE